MKFIVFEGIDGSGKSSALLAVKKHLDSVGVSYMEMRHPGGTLVGESLRKIIKTCTMSPESEVHLFAASFKEAIDQVVHTGKVDVLLCDRWIYSTYAYQSAGRGLQQEKVTEILKGVIEVTPDALILFDCSSRVAGERTAQRGEKDKFEREGATFQERVCQSYLSQIMALKGVIPVTAIIDTEKSDRVETAANAVRVVDQVLGRSR